MAVCLVVVTTVDTSYELHKHNVVIVTWKKFINNITAFVIDSNQRSLCGIHFVLTFLNAV